MKKTFQVRTDDQNYIIGYAIIGGFTDGIELEGDPPEGFAKKFKGYRLVGERLIFDEERYGEVQKAQERDAARVELDDIMLWFMYYENQLTVHAQFKKRGLPSAVDVDALESEAKEKQARIEELKAAIGI